MKKNRLKNSSKSLQKFLINICADFLATNSMVRKIRLLNTKFVRPFIFRFSLFLVVFFIASFFLLRFFNPNLLLELENKAYSKFLSIIASVKKQQFKVKIIGVSAISKQEIIKTVDEFYSNQDSASNNAVAALFIDDLIDELKSKFPLIDKIRISRSIPNSLLIDIVEFVPFTIWFENGHKFLIDQNGNSIVFREQYSELLTNRQMVILSGKNANLQAKSLFELLQIDSEFSKNIYSASWIGERRWDLRLNDGLLVKLPEMQTKEAWDDLIKIWNSDKSGLKLIDLRVKGKIYLEYLGSDSEKAKNKA